MPENPRFRKALLDSRVPPHLHEGLLGWIEQGTPPGGFLEAVIQNDLVRAISKADEGSYRQLRDLIYFLTNHAPYGSFYAKDAIHNWPMHVRALARQDETSLSFGLDRVLAELAPLQKGGAK